MAIARRRESVLENERAESLLAGPRRRERDRNGAGEREKKQSREKRERQTGRKRKRGISRAAGKEGTEGRSGARKGKEKTGRRTKEAPSTDEGQRWELKGETDDAAEVRRFSP